MLNFRLDEPAFNTTTKSSMFDSKLRAAIFRLKAEVTRIMVERLGRDLQRLSPRVRGQHPDGAACDSRSHAVGAACQNDWHPRAQHQPGAVGVGQERELL